MCIGNLSSFMTGYAGRFLSVAKTDGQTVTELIYLLSDTCVQINMGKRNIET